MTTTQLNQQTRPVSYASLPLGDAVSVQNQQILGSDSVVLLSERTWGSILAHFHFAFTSKTLKETFRELVENWKHETEYMSSIQQITSNASYQQIIGMGEEALPLIFEEMRRQPGHWFLALQRITRVNPTQPHNRGNMKQMTVDWLSWGRNNGYIRF